MSGGRRHWILTVMDEITDPRFYDGLIAGIAVVATLFVAVLWWTGN